MASKPKTSAALEAYIERIGASEINFRSWQVKEFKGKYYFEKAYIKINADGEIICPADYAPTPMEAQRIKEQWDEASMPKSVPARNTQGIKLLNSKSVLYHFYNDQGLITFVQERTDPKAYLPWSYWSDGKWRQMQPDGKIPLWRPKRKSGYDPTGKIMLHEGAKAADAAGKLQKGHPWYEDLKNFEHWGVVGGALAVNRADYDMLKRDQPGETIYVCDNDHPGRSMLQWVSKNYGGRLVGVVVDTRFKDGWDFADPLPDEFYNEDKEYIGPAFAQFKKPATYATEIIQPTEKGEKSFTVIRRHFAEEWHHVVSPEAFIHRDYPSRILLPKEFNNLVAPYSQARETAQYLVKDDAGKGYAIAYDPGRLPGIYSSDDGQYINTHQTARIKELESVTKAEIKPFIEFMEHLCPEEKDRTELMRWCATLIAKPAVKMHYGVLLISETQGVGKGTLGEKILAPLVGVGNTSFPGEEEIVDSKYNYWMAHKRLAVVHEIYAGHSSRAYNKMKSVITDKNIEVRKKYFADYRIDNWIHVFACSNSPRALKLSMDDRRWLVPKVREEKRSEEYWETFHTWLYRKHGLAKIRRWALDFKNYVKTGTDAPWTSIKRSIVEEGYSDGQQLVANVLAAIRDQVKEPVLISDNAMVDLIKNVIYEGRQTDKLEKPVTVRAVAKQEGYFIGEPRVKAAEWGTVIKPCRVIATSKADADADPRTLIEAGRKLFNVEEFYSKHGQKL